MTILIEINWIEISCDIFTSKEITSSFEKRTFISMNSSQLRANRACVFFCASVGVSTRRYDGKIKIKFLFLPFERDKEQLFGENFRATKL